MASLKCTIFADFEERWTMIDLPASLDPTDYHCCGKANQRVVLAYEVIQYGLIWDKHVYFTYCPVCKSQYVSQCEMQFSGED